MKEAETFAPPFQQAQPVTMEAIDKIEEGWKAYALDPGKGTSRTSRLNMGGVSALSRRLMAVERARALGRKPFDLRMWALEQAASVLAEGRKEGTQGRAQKTVRGGNLHG
ncbi:MAG: hypothetical protein Q8O76_12300 [Chloroflexota bacterium]|nr:hypothetical protein [Chloroflexota bacterium]